MITADMVRRCRDATGSSMMECKKGILKKQREREMKALLLQSVAATDIHELRSVLTTLISYQLREMT